MNAIDRLKLAAAVVAFGTPTAVAGSVEYESHPGVGMLCGILLAGGASVVALANAVGAADERGREQVRAAAAAAEDDVPPSARTPLNEEPPGGGLEAAFAAGFAYAQQLAVEQQLGPHVAPDPADEPRLDTTAVDMAPEQATHEMAAVPETPPVAPAAPWSAAGLEFMRVLVEPPRPPRHAAPPADDLYAHPSLGETTIGFFTAAADRQARDAA